MLWLINELTKVAVAWLTWQSYEIGEDDDDDV